MSLNMCSKPVYMLIINKNDRVDIRTTISLTVKQQAHESHLFEYSKCISIAHNNQKETTVNYIK